MTDEELFEAMRDMEYRKPRRVIRYMLYRLRNEAEGGAKAALPTAEEQPVLAEWFAQHKLTLKRFKAFFEGQPAFTRWVDFGSNWDLPADKRIKQEVIDRYQARANELGVSPKVNIHRLTTRDYEDIPWPGPVAIVRLRGELQEWQDYVAEVAKEFPGVTVPGPEGAEVAEET